MPTKNDFDPNCITQSQMNMIHNSRIYYRRLTTWFWTYLFSRYWGIGTAEDAFGRLYLEALDIGNMLQILFSREYAEQYSQLLSRFAITLRELLDAQSRGDTEAVNQAVNSLYENVAERAAFLARINPYWSEEEYNELLGTYTRYILEDANAIASRDFIEDLELHDRFISINPPFCERHRWGYEIFSQLYVLSLCIFCYTPPAGRWHTTEPEEVSGGAV